MKTKRKSRRFFRGLALFLSLVLAQGLCFTSPAIADHDGGSSLRDRLSEALERLAEHGGSEWVDVIVVFEPGSRAASLARRFGGRSRNRFRHFPFESMRIPARALKLLARHPSVKFISRDAPIDGMSLSAKATLNQPTSYPNVDFDGDGPVSKLFGTEPAVRGRLVSLRMDRSGNLKMVDTAMVTANWR